MDIQENRKILKSRFGIAARILRSTNEFVEDMHALLQNGNFADITLRCESEVFRVHRNILSARSPVFAAMFLNPMRESQQEYVDIQGIEPSILQMMLSYIYCSRTGPLTASVACDLLSAADMYQLSGLKRHCLEFLQYVMCEENVLHIIRVADLYDESLRADAAKFICERYGAIESKKEWKTLQTEKPHLVIEVMALKINSLKCCDECGYVSDNFKSNLDYKRKST